MSVTTERCYHLSDGTLKVIVRTGHPLSAREVEALDGVADSYRDCIEAPRFPATVDDDDLALWELGGEENICAG